jgi:hypothetical protein
MPDSRKLLFLPYHALPRRPKADFAFVGEWRMANGEWLMAVNERVPRRTMARI